MKQLGYAKTVLIVWEFYKLAVDELENLWKSPKNLPYEGSSVDIICSICDMLVCSDY